MSIPRPRPRLPQGCPESPHYSQDLTLYGGCPPRVLTRRGRVCGVSGLLQRASGGPAEQAPGESPEPQPLGRGRAAPERPGRRQDQGALHPGTWDAVPHSPGCLGSRGSSPHSCLYLFTRRASRLFEELRDRRVRSPWTRSLRSLLALETDMGPERGLWAQGGCSGCPTAGREPPRRIRAPPEKGRSGKQGPAGWGRGMACPREVPAPGDK